MFKFIYNKSALGYKVQKNSTVNCKYDVSSLKENLQAYLQLLNWQFTESILQSVIN